MEVRVDRETERIRTISVESEPADLRPLVDFGEGPAQSRKERGREDLVGVQRSLTDVDGCLARSKPMRRGVAMAGGLPSKSVYKGLDR